MIIVENKSKKKHISNLVIIQADMHVNSKTKQYKSTIIK